MLNMFEEKLQKEHWEWDYYHKSPEVLLSSDARTAYFYVDPVQRRTGTAGVRAVKGFVDGEHYWEVKFLEPPIGSSVMVGVGTEETCLLTDNYQFVNLIGRDSNSWGLSYKGTVWHDGKQKQYCEPFYDNCTVIGVHLNLYANTLTFYKNGQCLGVAFTNLPSGVPLYPVISSTSDCTELEVCNQMCRYLTLQEKCLLAIARSLHKPVDATSLPLPGIIKEHIQELKAH